MTIYNPSIDREDIYFMECALSQNILLPLLMVHFVTRMYYYYYYYSINSIFWLNVTCVVAFIVTQFTSVDIIVTAAIEMIKSAWVLSREKVLNHTFFQTTYNVAFDAFLVIGWMLDQGI